MFVLKMTVAHILPTCLSVACAGTNLTDTLFIEDRPYMGPHLNFLIFWRYRKADRSNAPVDLLEEDVKCVHLSFLGVKDYYRSYDRGQY